MSPWLMVTRIWPYFSLSRFDRLPARVAVRRSGTPLPGRCQLVGCRARLQKAACWTCCPHSHLRALCELWARAMGGLLCAAHVIGPGAGALEAGHRPVPLPVEGLLRCFPSSLTPILSQERSRLGPVLRTVCLRTSSASDGFAVFSFCFCVFLIMMSFETKQNITRSN